MFFDREADVPKTLLMITSPPGSPEARRALDIARVLRDAGHSVVVALLQDAVLAALNATDTPAAQAVHDLLAQEVPIYVARHDLALRGFSVASLAADTVIMDDRTLVDLVFADGTRTLGCF